MFMSTVDLLVVLVKKRDKGAILNNMAGPLTSNNHSPQPPRSVFLKGFAETIIWVNSCSLPFTFSLPQVVLRIIDTIVV